MPTVPEIINQKQCKAFSFEVLPPLKGKGIEKLFCNIDSLMEFDPAYINITTHRSEMVYKSTPDGLYRRVSERSRPGTVAVLPLYSINSIFLPSLTSFARVILKWKRNTLLLTSASLK